MGLVYADIQLTSIKDIVLAGAGYMPSDKIKTVNVSALVDSGAYMLAINETVQGQLQLPFLRREPSTLADDSVIELDIVGPVEVRFENRTTNVDAVVLPGDAEVLLGAIPMEAMDVLIDPLRRSLIVNPKHPLRAQLPLK
jgi:clan AA aspartic protease